MATDTLSESTPSAASRSAPNAHGAGAIRSTSCSTGSWCYRHDTSRKLEISDATPLLLCSTNTVPRLAEQIQFYGDSHKHCMLRAHSLQGLLSHALRWPQPRPSLPTTLLKPSSLIPTSHSRWHTGRSPRPSLPTTSTAGRDSLKPRQSAALASLPAPSEAERTLVRAHVRCRLGITPT